MQVFLFFLWKTSSVTILAAKFYKATHR